MKSKHHHGTSHRVVFSGGPAAGKTAILEIVRRHLPAEVAVIPESATMLFLGGLPRHDDIRSRRIVQRTIFDLQKNLEALYDVSHPELTHVCDRGSLDGAAYWPGGPASFLKAMGTSLDVELRRYAAVVFLESTAHDVKSWPHDNPQRIESPEEACALDKKLRAVWGRHPNFHFVPRTANFYEKVATCLITLDRILGIGHVHPKPEIIRRQP